MVKSSKTPVGIWIGTLILSILSFGCSQPKEANFVELPTPVPTVPMSMEDAITPMSIDSLLTSIDTSMIWVEGGSFQMGSNTIQGCKPQHNVSVSSFYMSKFFITVEQFRCFIHNTNHKTSADLTGGGYVVDKGDKFIFKKGVNWRCDEYGVPRPSDQKNYPVLYVNWHDGKAFCDWLSKISGKKYRLPTEAEWEFAAKGGVKSKGYLYSGSNNLDEVAWHAKNAKFRVHPVGLKKPNELGLYDMTGNIWQWCDDWYGEDYYHHSPTKDPKGPKSGTEKVCKGACFLSGFPDTPADQLYPAFRGRDTINVVANDVSFRIVREP